MTALRRRRDTVAVALQDPQGFLPGLEWQTREQLQALASRFRAVTGLDLRVRSGRRTCAEQNALYAQGRDGAGEIITYASGCTSWHVLGRAADLDPITPSGVGQAESAYRTAGAIWVAMGGVYGGNFSGFPDLGHFEWHPGLTIEQVCPSPTYCAQIEASIQTIPPLGRYLVLGAVVAGAALFGLRRLRKHRLAI